MILLSQLSEELLMIKSSLVSLPNLEAGFRPENHLFKRTYQPANQKHHSNNVISNDSDMGGLSENQQRSGTMIAAQITTPVRNSPASVDNYQTGCCSSSVSKQYSNGLETGNLNNEPEPSLMIYGSENNHIRKNHGENQSGANDEYIAKSQPPGSTTVIRGNFPQVSPRKYWYFDGQTPANYIVSTVLSSNRTGGTFNWDVSPQLVLSSAGSATPTVTSAAPSAAQRDAFIRLRHTDAAGRRTAASYRVTVLAPTSLTHINNVDNADATWGYSCEIHYSIKDQFGTILPHNVPINEQWTSGITADSAGMDWRRGAEGSATVSPTNWFDHIQGETSTHTPTPVSPAHASAGTAVYHWTGDWRVGSLTIGSGRRVISVTWQKNRGHARHT